MSDGPLYGLEGEPLPERWTPLEAIAVIKCLDVDGGPALVVRSTPTLRSWESVGLLTAALDTERASVQSGFVSEEEDDD